MCFFFFCKRWNSVTANVVAIHVPAGQGSIAQEAAQRRSAALVLCCPVASLRARWHEWPWAPRSPSQTGEALLGAAPPLCSPCLLPCTGWMPIISFVWILKMRWGKQIALFWVIEGGRWRSQRILAAAVLLCFKTVWKVGHQHYGRDTLRVPDGKCNFFCTPPLSPHFSVWFLHIKYQNKTDICFTTSPSFLFKF